MSFERLDESRLFAADVRAGAARDRDVEIEIRSEDFFAEETFGARFFESFLENGGAVIELAANVDVRHRIRSDGERRDDHSFDEKMRIFFDEQAIFERARLRLVRIAEQIRRLRRIFRNEAPLHSSRKSCTAAAAQFRILHDLDDLIRRPRRDDLARLVVAAAFEIDVDRSRIRLVDVGEENFDRLHD